MRSACFAPGLEAAFTVAGISPVHSSTIRCALFPPNPKLLIAALRGPDFSHGSAFARSRKPYSSMAARGSSHGVGGYS